MRLPDTVLPSLGFALQWVGSILSLHLTRWQPVAPDLHPTRYSSSLLSTGNIFQDSPWMPETLDYPEPYTHSAFSSTCIPFHLKEVVYGWHKILYDSQNGTQFKTEKVFFWKFPFNIFGPQLTTGNWNCGKQTADKRGLLYKSGGKENCFLETAEVLAFTLIELT